MDVLYVACALLSILSVVLYLQNKSVSKKYALKLQKEMDGFKGKIEDLSRETERQAFVIDYYKERLHLKANKAEVQESDSGEISNLVVGKDIIRDKQQLEKDKERFLQKNKKLWEQSLAVYKQKEKIETLRKHIEFKHNELTQSINYAVRIQEALLPSVQLLEQIIPKHFILFRPRDIVSGDFYWSRQLDNKVVVVAADCTGHGVPGAFMSLLGISYLNEIIGIYPDISASQLLEKMRDKVKAGFKQNDGSISIPDGMDMAVCIINQDTLQLEFSGANNGMYLARDKEIQRIKGTRNPVSAFLNEIPFESQIIQLQQGDKVFLYSDGYFDQFGGSENKKMKRAGFNKSLQYCLNNDSNMSAIKKQLEKDLDFWQGNEEQVDDVLILGVQV